MEKKYSVLMSVYYKESPLFFKQSINSMIEQTIKPDEIVLICDGKLTQELDEVINGFEKKYSKLFNIIRFEKNYGLGHALRYGLEACKNELIARMDTDDISKKDRCEKELEIFDKEKNVGIVGSNIEEFSKNENDIETIRKVPEKHEDIVKFMKKRNPFNHPSVMYKKSEVLKAGNYQEVRFMQDYFLWVDMICNGTIGYNIQENLVSMRANDNLFKRRSGREYFIIQKKLLKNMKKKKMINSFEYIFYLTIRSVSSMLPNSIRKFIFKNILRKKAVK